MFKNDVYSHLVGTFTFIGQSPRSIEEQMEGRKIIKLILNELYFSVKNNYLHICSGRRE